MRSYLTFERLTEHPRDLKTEVWAVISTRHGDELGVIKWYGPWRQYAFFPRMGTVWNPDCLDQVTEQIRGLMRARKRNTEATSR